MVIDIVLSNGKHLILDADIQIDWVQENMFFEEDVKLRGKYSYPFSIDRRSNSDALGFPDLIQVNEEIIKVGCRVYVSGIEFYKGQLNILDWDDDVINIAITRNTEEIDTNQFIDEMDLPSYSGIAAYSQRNTDNPKTFPEIDYAWPQLYNYNETSNIKYGLSSSPGAFVIINYNNGNSEQLFGTELAIPMFYMYSVLKNIFLKLGLSLKSPIYTDSFLSKVLIFNTTVPGTNITSNHKVYFALSNSTKTEATFILLNKTTINAPVGGVIVFDVVEYNNSEILNTTTVTYTITSTDVSLGYTTLMQNIRDQITTDVSGTSVTSENYTSPQPAFSIEFTSGSNIAFVNYGQDVTLENLNNFSLAFINLLIDYKLVYTYSGSVEMKNHLPHITISSLLNSIRSYFNLAIIIDEVNQVVKIYRRNDIVKPYTKEDMSQYLLNVNEGEPYKAPNYKFTFDHDSDNDSLTEFLQSETSNIEAGIDPVTEWEINAGTLATELLRNSNSGFITTPKINQELGDYYERARFGLRFLFHNGYIADTAGKKIVSATNDGLLPDQVFNNQVKDWYDIIKRMRKAPVMYMDFGFDKLKSMEPFVWKVMDNDFLWKRITTTIHNTNGIMPSKVEGFKL